MKITSALLLSACVALANAKGAHNKLSMPRADIAKLGDDVKPVTDAAQPVIVETIEKEIDLTDVPVVAPEPTPVVDAEAAKKEALAAQEASKKAAEDQRRAADAFEQAQVIAKRW